MRDGRDVFGEHFIDPHMRIIRVDRPGARGGEVRGDPRVSRINERVVLIIAGVIPACHINGVGAAAQAGERNRRLGRDRRLRAPGAVVESPFVVCVAPEVGRDRGAPVERAARPDGERGACGCRRDKGLAVNQDAGRVRAAAVVFRAVTVHEGG